MKKLSIINIIYSILSLIIMLLVDIHDNFFYVIFLTGIIWFIMPFFCLFISSILNLRNIKHKVSLIANVLSASISLLIIIYIIRLINKNMIVVLILYILVFILNIINVIFLYKYIKNHPDLEKEEFKKIKKETNGIMK